VFQTSTSVRPTQTTVLTVRSASTSTAASAVWTMSPTLLVSPVQFSSSFLWWWACLSVCLSVCSHIFACLRNYTSELHQVSRAINCDHGSVQLFVNVILKENLLNIFYYVVSDFKMPEISWFTLLMRSLTCQHVVYSCQRICCWHQCLRCYKEWRQGYKGSTFPVYFWNWGQALILLSH